MTNEQCTKCGEEIKGKVYPDSLCRDCHAENAIKCKCGQAFDEDAFQSDCSDCCAGHKCTYGCGFCFCDCHDENKPKCSDCETCKGTGMVAQNALQDTDCEDCIN